jgi:hypothetical protein
MYRDVVQWSKIRHRILVKGDSRRQVARETGISTNTIDKMSSRKGALTEIESMESSWTANPLAVGRATPSALIARFRRVRT